MGVPAALGAAVGQRDCPEHLSSSQQDIVLETRAVALQKWSCLVPVVLHRLIPPGVAARWGTEHQGGGLVMLAGVCSPRESK